MALKNRDKEFRTPKVTYLEFKHTEMDRVLTMLFPRLKYDGYGSRREPRGTELTIEEFLQEFIDHPEWFEGFEDYPSVVSKWIETDLMDIVNRGKPNQAIAAPRPLHGNTYKFRNSKHTRDYGAAEQIYWMLYFARKGKGQAARDILKRFFFQGIDLVTDCYNASVQVDVETQAILRLDQQVQKDMKDSKDPNKAIPLCIGQADLLAEDILRLLAYENYIPRSVLIEYLKTLIAFHLSLYHLKLINILPKLIKQQSINPKCTLKDCSTNIDKINSAEECPYNIAIIVDMGDINNTHMAKLAIKSVEYFYRRIPAFIQSNYIIKKLDEMAEYLAKRGKVNFTSNGEVTISNLLELLGSKYSSEREPYFKSRLANIIEESTAESEAINPEIKKILDLDLNDFDTFIEILMVYRGKYHRQYITETLDSLLLKNKDNGLLVQSRKKGNPRKFFLGSKLLEVLLQIAVLTEKDGQFVTQELLIEDLLNFLKDRYGIYVDRLPKQFHNNSSILDKKALRLNLDTFKKRLREIGFYENLSDAFISQKISPRYKIESNKLKNDL